MALGRDVYSGAFLAQVAAQTRRGAEIAELGMSIPGSTSALEHWAPARRVPDAPGVNRNAQKGRELHAILAALAVSGGRVRG
jgi:hypothetical protein